MGNQASIYCALGHGGGDGTAGILCPDAGTNPFKGAQTLAAVAAGAAEDDGAAGCGLQSRHRHHYLVDVGCFTGLPGISSTEDLALLGEFQLAGRRYD